MRVKELLGVSAVIKYGVAPDDVVKDAMKRCAPRIAKLLGTIVDNNS